MTATTQPADRESVPTPTAKVAGPDTPSLAIVITTLNRPDRFASAVSELCDQITATGLTATTRLAVVFDGCRPYPEPQLDTLPIDVTVAHNPAPTGIANARNQGIGLCPDADLIAFVDDDAIPAPTWLASLLRGVTTYPDKWCFGGRVHRANPDGNLLAALRDEVYYRETFGPWYADPDWPARDLIGPPYVSGGNAVYRHHVFDRFGLFRPDLPAYVDVEFGLRVRCEHHGVLLDGLTIGHHHPSTLRGYLRRAFTSGQARCLLRADHTRHRPAGVFGEIARNVLHHNIERARRLDTNQAGALTVLTLQEVIHGIGYLSIFLTRRG